MSEHIVRVKLSELKTVRVMCKNANCGAVVEAPVGELHKLFHNCQCRFCNQPFRAGNQDYLALLAQTVEALNAISDRVEVEFVLPAEAP